MKLKNKKEKNLEVTFWSKFQGMCSVPDIKPYRLNSDMPEWWKKMSYVEKSIKSCPGVIDLTSSIYVLPMWTDIKITINDRPNRIFSWETLLPEFKFYNHEDKQFLDHTGNKMKNDNIGILKTDCPWFLKTPPGYSVLQMSAFYSFNTDFDVPTGIIDTDFYHEINTQLIIKSSKDSFIIERGQPLVYFFPFKRDRMSLNVREGNDQDKVSEGASKYIALTKFSGGYKRHRSEIEKN
jgi:dUTPase